MSQQQMLMYCETECRVRLFHCNDPDEEPHYHCLQCGEHYSIEECVYEHPFCLSGFKVCGYCYPHECYLEKIPLSEAMYYSKKEDPQAKVGKVIWVDE